MITVSKVISTKFDKFKRLVVKILRRGAIIDGKGDLLEPIEAGPFGMDSNPVEGKIALFIKSETYGKFYVVGYLNTERKAAVGENRLFSTDENGTLAAFVWIKNDGTIQLNGAEKHLARFEELKTGFDSLRTDFNALVTKFNAHVHPVPGVTPGVGATTSSVTATPGNPSTASIDSSKANNIKTE